MKSVYTRLECLEKMILPDGHDQDMEMDPLSQAIENYHKWWDGLSEEEKAEHLAGVKSDKLPPNTHIKECYNEQHK